MHRIPIALTLALAVASSAVGQDRTTGHALGDVDADVVVTVFSDFACAYCAVFARETFPAIREEYVETGRVRWLHIPFVLGSFPNSGPATTAAECAADQDAFWPMHDLLFERQPGWTRAPAPARPLAAYARELGLDEAAFTACAAGDRDELRRGDEMARVARVRATPTFFINGKRLEGAVPLEAFRALLDEALKE